MESVSKSRALPLSLPGRTQVKICCDLDSTLYLLKEYRFEYLTLCPVGNLANNCTSLLVNSPSNSLFLALFSLPFSCCFAFFSSAFPYYFPCMYFYYYLYPTLIIWKWFQKNQVLQKWKLLYHYYFYHLYYLYQDIFKGLLHSHYCVCNLFL